MERTVHVKMLSEDALIYLKKNIDKITKLIIENDDNSWVRNEFPQPMFVEKKYEFFDFDLLNNPEASDKDVDFKNSVTIYEHLKELPRYILCDERFWLWLHFEKYYSVVKSLMNVNGKTTILDHWTHAKGNRRGLMFGVLSRMYFRVALTVDENAFSKYELTRWIIENPERFRNLTWRAYSSEEHIVRGVVKGEMRALSETGAKENHDFYAVIGKYVSVIGSARILDMISEEDISNMIYDKMIELIDGDKNK